MSVRIIGFDPGLAKSGFACLELGGTIGLTYCGAGHLELKPSGKKERRVDEDLTRRLKLLCDFYREQVEQHKPKLAVFENLSSPRNSSSAGKIGLAWGALYSICHERKMPVVVYSPQEIKEGIGLARNASKQEVEDAVRRAIRSRKWPKRDDGKRDHIFDAAGAVLALSRDSHWTNLLWSCQ